MYHAASSPRHSFTFAEVCEVWRGENYCKQFLAWGSEVPGLRWQETSRAENVEDFTRRSGHSLLVGIWFVPRLG